MSLDTATGEITGTPTATGTTNFKVFAYNQYAASIKDVTVKVIDLANWKYSMDLQTMKYTGQGSDHWMRPDQVRVRWLHLLPISNIRQSRHRLHNRRKDSQSMCDDKVNDSNGRWLASAPTNSNP